MKILIIGEQGSGKTTLRSMLAEMFPEMAHFSTSDFIISLMSDQTLDTIDHIRRHKEQFRPEMVNIGNKLCDAYAGVLVSACLFAAKTMGREVTLDGVRRINEFEAVADNFDLILYIEREGNEPSKEDNFELQGYKTDSRVTIVENNGEPKDMLWSVINAIKDTGQV